MTTQQATAPVSADTARIGREIWPMGRLIRLVLGAIGVGTGVTELITDDLGAAVLMQTFGYVAGITAFYLVLHGLLGERLLAKLDPFVTTVVVLGPLFLMGALLPGPIHTALGLYVGASLVVTALIRYGGCEVIAPSILLFGRRYISYCPFNLIDAAERPMRRSDSLLMRGAAVITLVVIGYFLLVDPWLDQIEAGVVSAWWALLLLGPAAVLAERAWRLRADRNRAFGFALGSAALVGGALILSGLLSDTIVFGAAVLAGLLLAGYRVITNARANRTASPGTEPPPAVAT